MLPHVFPKSIGIIDFHGVNDPYFVVTLGTLAMSTSIAIEDSIEQKNSIKKQPFFHQREEGLASFSFHQTF
jgi:hypothetical protein